MCKNRAKKIVFDEDYIIGFDNFIQI
jgi:hypothetical protein